MPLPPAGPDTAGPGSFGPAHAPRKRSKAALEKATIKFKHYDDTPDPQAFVKVWGQRDRRQEAHCRTYIASVLILRACLPVRAEAAVPARPAARAASDARKWVEAQAQDCGAA